MTGFPPVLRRERGRGEGGRGERADSVLSIGRQGGACAKRTLAKASERVVANTK